jgi:transmembrane sensor
MMRTFKWFSRSDRIDDRDDQAAGEVLDRLVSRDIARLSAQDPDTIRQWHVLKARIEAPSRAREETLNHSNRRWLKPSIGFALASAAVVVFVVLLRHQPASPLQYQTGTGQQSSISLADGSEVRLNHNTTLEVNRFSTPGGRRTKLAGEAYFKVTQNESPFIVETKLGAVQVVGTEFNVRVHEDAMEVIVVRGKVRVAAIQAGRESTMVLQGGQMTTLAKGGFPKAPQGVPFAGEYPGWVHGKFLFNRTGLPAACREIAEQFGVAVTLRDSRLNNETITGVIDGKSVEGAVKTLCALSGASYRYENSVYTLY